MQRNESASEGLEQVLNETALAIRSGNLAAMAELAKRTELALAELGAETDAVRIEALRDLAKRNELGLEAAKRGVRAARRRLAEITSALSGVQTYDHVGKPQKIAAPLGILKARL